MRNSFMTWMYLLSSALFAFLGSLWVERVEVGMLYVLAAIGFLVLAMLEQIRMGVWRKKKGPQEHKIHLSDKVGTRDGH